MTSRTAGSATKLAQKLAAEGVATKHGRVIDKGDIYKLLNNRVYIGEAVHKGTAYPGEHEAIVSQELWDIIHMILSRSPRTRAANTRAQTPALLKGLIFAKPAPGQATAVLGVAMSPTHTRRGGKLYRYYVSQSVIKGGADACAVRRLVGLAENDVRDALARLGGEERRRRDGPDEQGEE